jgi:hypothetical protein
MLGAVLEPGLRVWTDGPGHRLKLLEIAAVLGSTAVLFSLLKEDMKTFGFAVYGGLVYVVLSAPDMQASLSTGLMGGILGSATEWWGCLHTGFWNWVDPSFRSGDLPTQSLFMIGGAPRGFPVEVVVAYAGAGFWMSSISNVVLAPEHRDFASGPIPRRTALPTLCLRVFEACLLLLAALEPTLAQPSLLLCAGVHLTHSLPPKAAAAVTAWGIIVGLSGTFFEMFATGGLFEDFAVWRYRRDAILNSCRLPVPFFRTAPSFVLPAYIGTGLILFSLSFKASSVRGAKHA